MKNNDAQASSVNVLTTTVTSYIRPRAEDRLSQHTVDAPLCSTSAGVTNRRIADWASLGTTHYSFDSNDETYIAANDGFLLIFEVGRDVAAVAVQSAIRRQTCAQDTN